LKKQRLIELQEKSKNNNTELSDIVEILSEFFISQSQTNKDLKNNLISVNNKLDTIMKKLDKINNYVSTEPLAQLLIDNLNSSDEIDVDEED